MYSGCGISFWDALSVDFEAKQVFLLTQSEPGWQPIPVDGGGQDFAPFAQPGWDPNLAARLEFQPGSRLGLPGWIPLVSLWVADVFCIRVIPKNS